MYAPPADKDKLGFALNVSSETLTFYEKLFKSNYPLKKLGKSYSNFVCWYLYFGTAKMGAIEGRRRSSSSPCFLTEKAGRQRFPLNF